MLGKFDPENVSEKDMEKLADHIEEYVNELEGIMIIPDELIIEYGEQIKNGIKRARKFINKLRKGDKSVFKDSDKY